MASHNQGKIREFAEILGNHWESRLRVTMACLRSPRPHHFCRKRAVKARHACRATGCAALADDSGLVVPALVATPVTLAVLRKWRSGE